MGTKLTAAAKQKRFNQLLAEIRKHAKSVKKIGEYLIEIRDDELWDHEDSEYSSWDDFLKFLASEVIGITHNYAQVLITQTEVRNVIHDDHQVLSDDAVRQISRLAPTVGKKQGAGSSKDFSQLDEEVVSEVIEAATEAATGDTPTAKDIRAAVDEQLGIDRAAERAKAKAKQDASDDFWYSLDNQVRLYGDTTADLLKDLRKVKDEDWDEHANRYPRTIAKAIKQVEAMLEFLKQ